MKILVVYYSMYGHVLQLARAVEEGAKPVAGVEVILRRVAEFEEVSKKTADNEFIVKVREQQADIPVCTLDDLREADGVIFGSPTRYGNMTAQMKQLIDSTATLWLKGELEGQAGRGLHFHRFHARWPGDYPVNDDGSPHSSWHGHCRRSVFH